MKNRRTWIALWGLLVGLALTSCSGDMEQSERPIRPVRFEEVVRWQGEKTRTLSGVSRAKRETELSFRVGGIIETIEAKVGEKVRKGLLIAAADDSEAKLDYEKAVDILKNAETQRDNSKSNLDRVKGLYENNNVSLSEYESAKDNYAASNSAHRTGPINVDLKEKELAYYKLYAPIDGIVTEVPAARNEQIQPGETIVTIVSGEEIAVNVGLPVSLISRVETGQTVSIEFSSLPGRVFDGVVSEVSFTAASGSSTYPVKIEVENPTSDVRPGMTADVTFTLSPVDAGETAALVVPSSAVGQSSEGSFVFVAVEGENDQATVKKRPISIGEFSNDGFEVLEGLQDGELVVTAGVESLSDGMIVRLLR